MALKQSSCGRVLLFALVLMAQPAFAQISAWKLGGAGLSWSESDTTRLFIDFVSATGSVAIGGGHDPSRQYRALARTG